MYPYKALLFILLLFSLDYSSVYSQNSSYRSEFGFISDNDAYLATGQDRYYTNGLFLNLRHAVSPARIRSDKVFKNIWEFNVAQQMYNPKSGYAPTQRYVDRPFAGYLFGSYARHWLFKNENSIRAEIQIGTIGQHSLADKGQEFYHHAFGFYNIDGWQYQIENEIGINTKVSYLLKLTESKNKKLDLSLPFSAHLGNYFSGLDMSALFRMGKINPLNNSVATNSSIGNEGKYKGEFYFFLKPRLSWVAYNATISGSMFNPKSDNEITFDSRPLVFAQEAGLAYAKERWNLGFSLTFKTKEIESSAKAHQYGSVRVAYKFGKNL